MTLKASPLGNRVVWAKRIPPDWYQWVVALWKSAPTPGIPRCSGTPSGCDSWVRLTGGTRLARTPRLLSGDTFGVLTIRMVFVVLTCATFGSCSPKHRKSLRNVTLLISYEPKVAKAIASEYHPDGIRVIRLWLRNIHPAWRFVLFVKFVFS